MRKLFLLAIPIAALTMPAIAADLDLPPYRERDVVIERPSPPRVVEKRIIVEHHYYEPAPVYEHRVYVEPRYTAEHVIHVQPYRYAYASWRPHYFFPHRAYWHDHRCCW
jgi:hypothetical protein